MLMSQLKLQIRAVTIYQSCYYPFVSHIHIVNILRVLLLEHYSNAAIMKYDEFKTYTINTYGML